MKKAIMILCLLVFAVTLNAPIVNAKSGVIRGSEIFSIWSNSTITYMDYNATGRIFMAVVTGENNTIGVFKIVFNASTPPRLVCFDNMSFTLNGSVQKKNGVTMLTENITWQFKKTNGTLYCPAINVTLIYRHSTHIIKVNLNQGEQITGEHETTTEGYTPTYLEAFLVAFTVSVVLPLLIVYVLSKHKRRVKK